MKEDLQMRCVKLRVSSCEDASLLAYGGRSAEFMYIVVCVCVCVISNYRYRKDMMEGGNTLVFLWVPYIQKKPSNS